MIRWCSYCQRYLAEVAPFDDYRMTHAVCEPCHERAVWEDPATVARAYQLRDFYDRVREAGRTGRLSSTAPWLDETERLGIAQLDFVLGCLQPMLREVGEAWVRGEVTAAVEHAASFGTEQLIAAVRERYVTPGVGAAQGSLDVLLATVPGNAHTIGVHVLELLLLDRGCRCACTTEVDDPEAFARIVAARRPRLLGLSIALPEQLAAAESLAAVVRALPFAPELILGGLPVRMARIGATDSSLPLVHGVDGVLARL